MTDQTGGALLEEGRTGKGGAARQPARRRRRLLTTLITSILLTLIGAQTAMAAGPEVFIAHRGLGGESQIKYGLPENSLPAWAWAHDHEDPQFPTIYDLDVQVDRDGRFWIMHDTGAHALRRTTNGDGSVRDHSTVYLQNRWLEIAGVDLNHNGNDDDTPYRIPTIDKALAQISGYGAKITLETKGSGWTQSRINTLKGKLSTYGVLDRTIVHSFDRDHLAWAKTAGIPLRGYVAPSGGPQPSVATVKNYGSYVFLRYNIATPAKVAEYKAAGIKVCIWTMDNGGEYDTALALGDVYAWVVDDLLEARDYLQQAS